MVYYSDCATNGLLQGCLLQGVVAALSCHPVHPCLFTKSGYTSGEASRIISINQNVMH